MGASYQPHWKDEQSFENGCRGKVRSTSKKLAVGRLRVMRRDGFDSPGLGVYKCKACGGWHLGNSWKNLPKES